jgi:hypothetical protein
MLWVIGESGHSRIPSAAQILPYQARHVLGFRHSLGPTLESRAALLLTPRICIPSDVAYLRISYVWHRRGRYDTYAQRTPYFAPLHCSRCSRCSRRCSHAVDVDAVSRLAKQPQKGRKRLMIQPTKNTNTECDAPDSAAEAATLDGLLLPLLQGFPPIAHAPWEMRGEASHRIDLVERCRGAAVERLTISSYPRSSMMRS